MVRDTRLSCREVVLGLIHYSVIKAVCHLDFAFFIGDSEPNIMSTEKSLTPAQSLFSPSITCFRKNIISFVVIGALPLLCGGAVVLSQILTAHGNDFLRTLSVIISIPLLIVGLVLGLASGPGLQYTQYQSAKGNIVMPFAVYKAVLHYGLRWWGLTLLTNMLYLFGFVCLVVPAFFLFKRYMLAPFYLFDNNVSIMEAMRQSKIQAEIYSESHWDLISVQILLGLVIIIPVLGIAFGWILPVLYSCAPAIRYFQIKRARITEPRYAR